jgi:hypothetical protein
MRAARVQCAHHQQSDELQHGNFLIVEVVRKLKNNGSNFFQLCRQTYFQAINFDSTSGLAYIAMVSLMNSVIGQVGLAYFSARQCASLLCGLSCNLCAHCQSKNPSISFPSIQPD